MLRILPKVTELSGGTVGLQVGQLRPKWALKALLGPQTSSTNLTESLLGMQNLSQPQTHLIGVGF